MILSRIKRVEELIKEQLAIIILQEVKDPRLDFVSVTGVKLSKDVRNADIFITSHNDADDHIKSILDALETANGFIRHALSQRVMLRYMPILKFHYDKSLAEASRIEALIQKIHEEESSS